MVCGQLAIHYTVWCDVYEPYTYFQRIDGEKTKRKQPKKPHTVGHIMYITRSTVMTTRRCNVRQAGCVEVEEIPIYPRIAIYLAVLTLTAIAQSPGGFIHATESKCGSMLSVCVWVCERVWVHFSTYMRQTADAWMCETFSLVGLMSYTLLKLLRQYQPLYIYIPQNIVIW